MLSLKIEMSKDILNNLMVFLDRVDIKGLKEIQAMNEILVSLQKPCEDSNKTI